jgi:hypothetical protein
LAKHTAIPLAAIAAVVGFLVARRSGASRRAAAGRAALLLATAALVVWAGYGFNVGRLVEPQSSGDLLDKLAASVPLPRTWVEWIARDLPVPAPRWFQSLVFQAAKQHDRLFFRYFGEMAKTGWWTYFPVVTLGKLTLGSIGLVAAGLATLRRRRISADEWVLLAAFAVPFALAILSRHNLGVRHVLSALPPLFVFAAVRIGRAVTAADGQVASRSGLFLTASFLLCLHAGEGFLASRNPIAWWNIAYGGTRNGWHVAGGANADWGQALWALRDVVRREDLQHVHVVAQAPAGAIAHLGEPRIEPMWWGDPLPTEGWLAISTSAPWLHGKQLFTDAIPERMVGGCYRLYKLPLPPR